MEFQYSYEIDPQFYETDGLDLGLPLRMHLDPYKEINGALRAQDDWSKNVRPVYGYKGGLGYPFSFIRVTVPECLPERLEIISYANEFAFLYDDAMEKLDLKGYKDGQHHDMLDAFGDEKALDQEATSHDGQEKKLQAQILANMVAIDPPRAITAMKAWSKFVQLASRTRTRPFDTLKEYIPSRVIDAGELIWFGTLTFGMGLTIPDEELELCMELARPGYAALGLTNDLYSWRKERDEAAADGLDYVFNAVWVIMQERSLSEEDAMIACAEEIRKQVAEFNIIVEKAKQDSSLSKDTRAYLEAVRYSHVGNLVWSIYCPRYHDY
ncbi:Fusicoccadiene synthase [Trichophyton interdigitale]|uniref:Fusicoccadiene synthase n=3 Tax=Trichophyton TaxID=5550 RepID=A0A9P5CVQ6_9EURO|nr:hypothetical protein TESG_07286 [Trichophyton tonsurans CBS 112818]EGE08995.1 fusicoccadiene synthase [Trichophyton equinum CBS 127.97]KAF3893366.1 Fusicoccadiene synthase [Trichophyton interdigitale]KAF3895668.1 Fusicoccadiene synthase [Trichophyton interdigitale]KAG8208680.1 Fusicoccadiene synthase [Trichophyton interdigitale]